MFSDGSEDLGSFFDTVFEVEEQFQALAGIER